MSISMTFVLNAIQCIPSTSVVCWHTYVTCDGNADNRDRADLPGLAMEAPRRN